MKESKKERDRRLTGCELEGDVKLERKPKTRENY